MYLSEPGGFHTDSSFLASNNAVAIPNLAGFWDVMSTVLHFLSVKYLTGLRQTPAVTIYTVDIGTAGVCRNPVLNIMVYPKHRWYEQIMIPEFSGMKFFEPEIFSKKFPLEIQIKFLISEKIQVPRLKTSRKVYSNYWSTVL